MAPTVRTSPQFPPHDVEAAVSRSRQTLSEPERRLVAGWAAGCAERVLHHYEGAHPGDLRPRSAIERARAYSRGELDTAEEIRRRFADGGAAREARSPSAAAAARAAGHAAAVCHMGAHALGAAGYAVKSAMHSSSDPADASAQELEWQFASMSLEVRDVLKSLPAVGEDRSGPLGPGLLSSGEVGEAIRGLQAMLRGGVI